MSPPPKPVPFLVAAAVMLLAILLYDVMGAIIKHLSQRYPAPELSMLRNLFGLVPTALILAFSAPWRAAGRPLLIRQWRLALFRGGLGAGAQICFYLALARLELATATTIIFAGPLFITLLSVPLLGHRVGFWRWLAVLAGFLGVLMVMQPTAVSFTWYAALPLLAALGYASISVTARLFDETLPTALINIYQTLGALAGAALLVAMTGGPVAIMGLVDWLWIAAMGMAGGLASFCLIAAYRLAEPSSLSPFEYFGIPFSFVLGWVFFAEAPFGRLLPGALLIVVAGLMIVWRERRARGGPDQG